MNLSSAVFTSIMDGQKIFGQDKGFRAQFDIVTARAVARMQVLSELTIPFLKVGGQLIALKSCSS